MLKRMKLIMVMLTLFYLVVFLTKAPSIDALDQDFIIGAHRGNSKDHIENSIEAIESALSDADYQFIEFDVQYTKDDIPVLYHDFTLLRIHKLSKKVENLKYEDLKPYNIARFEEAMELINNQKPINIEIKPSSDYNKNIKLTEYVIDYCKKNKINNILLSSISPDIIKYISDNHPEIKTGVVIWIHPITYLHLETIVNEFYDNMQDIGADYVMLYGMNIKNKNILELKPDNINIAYWYFTDKLYVLNSNTKTF